MKKMKKIVGITCLLLGALIQSAFVAETALSGPNPPQITVNIINSAGKKTGTAQLTQKADKVNIRLKAENLPPGKHGFHFHTIGNCDVPDFESAGPHFNPTDKQHGFYNPKGFHAGDLPNIKVGQDGKVQADIITKNVTLVKGKQNSLLKPEGTALVIHEKADDYVTDPAGDSGDRIACGVIR